MSAFTEANRKAFEYVFPMVTTMRRKNVWALIERNKKKVNSPQPTTPNPGNTSSNLKSQQPFKPAPNGLVPNGFLPTSNHPVNSDREMCDYSTTPVVRAPSLWHWGLMSHRREHSTFLRKWSSNIMMRLVRLV